MTKFKIGDIVQCKQYTLIDPTWSDNRKKGGCGYQPNKVFQIRRIDRDCGQGIIIWPEDNAVNTDTSHHYTSGIYSDFLIVYNPIKTLIKKQLYG